MVPQLPTEIWLLIGRYLRDDDDVHWENLLPVNRVLFELAMDRKYQNITLRHFNSQDLALVMRLGSPLISKRIVGLRLELNRLDRQFLTATTPTNNNSLRGSILKAAQRFTRSQPVVPVTARSSPFEEVIESLSAKFPTFTHLEDISIDSWNLSTEINLHPFFSSAWLTFGKNLRRLSLGGNLDGYRILSESQPVLDSLRELSLEFTDALLPTTRYPLPDSQVLVDCVAPLINKVLPRLTLLKIWSWASEDLSNLFLSLNECPNLETIDILAAFNRSFTQDASGLTRLLYSCSSSMKNLKLRLQPSGFANQVSDLQLSHWFSRTVLDCQTFAVNLQFLQIYPSNTSEGLDALTFCLQRSSRTLQTLIIKPRYLHEPEILTLCLALPPTLRHLYINIFALTGTALDAIGRRLPCLADLRLHIASPVLVNDATMINGSPVKLPNLHLTTLRLSQGGNDLDDQTLRAIENCIPSLHN